MAIVAENAHITAEMSNNRGEIAALVAGCGAYKLDRTLFSLTGRDRVRWLNGMVTNNIRDLAVGHGVYAFVLNVQGQIQGDLYAFNRGENLLVEIERVQVERLMPLFRRYIIMDKVEIEDLSGKMSGIGVAGRKSAEVLSSLRLGGQELEALQVSELNWDDTPATIVRGDNLHTENYEVWVPAEKIASLWNALLAAGGVPVQDETLETFRILCGIPKFGEDVRDRTLPQETGQDRALSFTKGCYIGQEIVERIRARGAVHRIFVGFELEGAAPDAGTKVQYEGKDVGEITSIMSAPLKQKRLALGYMRKEAMEPSRTFKAGDATARAVALPFAWIFP